MPGMGLRGGRSPKILPMDPYTNSLGEQALDEEWGALGDDVDDVVDNSQDRSFGGLPMKSEDLNEDDFDGMPEVGSRQKRASSDLFLLEDFLR